MTIDTASSEATTMANEGPDSGTSPFDGGGVATRPEGLPEKFWDDTTGAVRTDALIKSYGELEKRFGGGDRGDMPQSADAYALKVPEILGDADPEVNTRLYEAGFSREQAQLVYDLASEKLMPLVAEMTGEVGAQAQLEKLHTHFGGADKWGETARQIGQWGKQHLSEDVYEALAGSYDGVLAMHALMEKSEPGLLSGGASGDGVSGEDDLRTMMRDPRYWRDRDPAYVRRIKAGYKALYPE
ncbi:capsid assembly protein [Varunaivibrio sulfuroxidans]|uniref:Uncharacterized protein n=1 Tax=Varunaivibrio sulfuroxidans TaxID=1773489 RepID=A0A4R3J896_9PROT|nr:hypothetical protein [Varunaivibrio sulfuroxidans]TCS61692.1 hypothetical protein EDD55_107101 [Varunaivibrio sulfuroxidans]WES32124.1 hypothetical protein P3M64_07135 [Varunaivibrio sulfuroxidans]